MKQLQMNVNMKYNTRIRNKAFLGILKKAILSAQSKGLRFIHYSVQSNHLHFIIEANGNRTLTAGMRSLTVTLARGLSEKQVQPERYHLRVLRTPPEVRNAIRYVVLNDLKHTGRKVVRPDAYSSVDSYFKLRQKLSAVDLDQPRSWLLMKNQ